jgi:hypothetical protein
LYRDAAQTLAQRNAGNAQRFNLYGTFTNSSNYERMFLEYNTTGTAYRIGTEKAGTGSARALELQVDGTTCFSIGTNLRTKSHNAFNLQDGVILQALASPRVVTLGWSNNADAGLLCRDVLLSIDGGNAVSSSVRLRNNGSSVLQIRNGDNNADADITAAALTLSGNLTISTKNIVTDTTTGTKIGTGTTQKLAFWNATPVVQPTAVADATDAASVITQLNALLTRMRNLGLIAT